MVDVVDENNNVLYSATKENAHKKGLLHRTIIAEVIDSKGKWMLVKRIENHYFILYEIFSDEKPRLNHESESYSTFTREELKTRIKNKPTEFGQAFHFLVKTFYPESLR